MDSSMVQQTIDTAVPPSTVAAHVSNHDAHHENGNEPSRTRRRHSLGTSHDHPELAQPTCEAVPRCRGCACVSPSFSLPFLLAAARACQPSFFTTVALQLQRSRCSQRPLCAAPSAFSSPPALGAGNYEGFLRFAMRVWIVRVVHLTWCSVV